MVRWVNHAMSFAMVLAFLAIFAVKLRWDGSAWLEHDHTIAATGVFDPPGDTETRNRGEGRHVIGLILTDLEDGATTGSQHSREILDETSHEIQTVASAIKSRGRIVVDFQRKAFEVGGGDVWEIRHDEIQGRFHCCREIGLVEIDLDRMSRSVGPRHIEGLRRNVHRRNPPLWSFGRQGDRDTAGSCAHIEHPSRRR